MTTPRIRMIAGPNGSGKTTLANYLRNVHALPLGFYLNPDELDRQIFETGQVDFDRWGLQVDATELITFIAGHPLSSRESVGKIAADRNVLTVDGHKANGYLASILSDYMRRRWLTKAVSFTFETVMSSRDKLELLRTAAQSGYRTYLYYVCTNLVAINEERVASRVLKGGHDVPREKISSRYQRSLKLLPDCIGLAHRAFLFDNSGPAHAPVAEFEQGTLVRLYEPLPGWFVREWLDRSV